MCTSANVFAFPVSLLIGRRIFLVPPPEPASRLRNAANSWLDTNDPGEGLEIIPISAIATHWPKVVRRRWIDESLPRATLPLAKFKPVVAIPLEPRIHISFALKFTMTTEKGKNQKIELHPSLHMFSTFQTGLDDKRRTH